MAAFEFSRLDKARNEIRLFTIKPAMNLDDIVEVAISTHSLDDAPDYVALSYTWGDQSQRRHIKAHGSRLSIPRNLYTALWQFRLGIRTETMYHWADAICIRQDDLGEKSQQIPLMGCIFRAACAVLVWLGPASDGSDLAMELINTWSSARKSDGEIDLPRFLSSEPGAFAEEAWVALSHLLRRPWWTRMWTYQEAVLSRFPHFLCGEYEIGFHTLINANWVWSYLLYSPSKFGLAETQLERLKCIPLYHVTTLCEHMLMRVRTENVQESHPEMAFRRQLFSIHELQISLHTREVTNDHDKLYAVLGVVEDLKFQVTPDYHKPVDEVYTEFMAKHVIQNSSLDMVSLSGIGVLSDDPSLTLKLPSWVPDLRSCSRWPNNLRRLRSNSYDQLRPTLDIDLRHKILRASGVERDTISTIVAPKKQLYEIVALIFVQCLQYQSTHPTGMNWLQVVFRTILHNRSDSRLPAIFGGSRQEELFWETLPGFLHQTGIVIRADPRLQSLLTSIVFKGIKLELENNCSEAALEEQLLGLFAGEPSSVLFMDCSQIYSKLSPEDKHISLLSLLRHSEANTLYRKYFTTQLGYIGLGPESMQAGDKLCFLFGSDSPCLLRPIGDSFAHVGSCFVYGLMEGEVAELVNNRKLKPKTFSIK